MSYHIRDAIYDDAPALADAVIEPIFTAVRGCVPDQCLTWLTKPHDWNGVMLTEAIYGWADITCLLIG